MAVKDLKIKVGVQGADKAERQLGKTEKGMKSLGSAALKVGGAFFAAKGIIAGFSGVVQAAARQEQAEKALQVALGRTSKALLDQASALQKVTTTGDEAIIEQQAFLASLKFTEDQIKNIIPVALDLSAATGISLESAVRNTSKTFSGMTGELGELVPQLRDLTKEEMEAGGAVKVLSDLFEGQAIKQTQTMAGSIEQMKNAVGDAAEAIGTILSPIVIAIAGSIKTLAENATEFAKSLSGVGEFIVSVGEKVGFFKEKAEELPPVINKVSSSTEKLNENANKVDIGKPFRDFIDNQAPSLEAGYDQFVNTLVDLDMHGKDRREQAWLATRSAFIKFTGDMVKERIKQFSAEEALDRASVASSAIANASKNAIQSTGAVTGYIRSLFQTLPWFVAAPMALAGGAFIVDLIKDQTGKISSSMSSGGIGFADGGIVPGSGNSDSVPAMLTPGEVILNQAQQENLVGGMGVTVNIQGNMIGNESFVRDTLIPEIAKAQNQGLA